MRVVLGLSIQANVQLSHVAAGCPEPERCIAGPAFHRERNRVAARALLQLRGAANEKGQVRIGLLLNVQAGHYQLSIAAEVGEMHNRVLVTRCCLREKP